ncbi:O-antigen ligase family protein [Arthrobacter crystallopoietes]|uniref:O-antigen ligase family protein n=1 Tax=Crystallibacter crystallopoietes TaxID=37928 RepID=UPI001ABE27FA|nr:O-antigen ligase family protein [Arthrobacter crystallopoietes]QTG79518.1 O-antigen ligase family protein [Arthrobacter crystallopoietes]
MKLSSSLILLAATTSTWTGIKVLEITLCDVLLAGALIVGFFEYLARSRTFSIPFWILSLPIALMVVFAVHALSGRLTTSVVAIDSPATNDGSISGVIVHCVRFVIATSIIGVLIRSEVVTHGSLRGKSLMQALMLGSFGSSLVAVLAELGLSFDAANYQIESERASGLAFHPNSLALATVISIPLLGYFSLSSNSRGWKKFFWRFALIVNLFALFYADSRGGLVVGFIVLIATGLFLMLSKRRMHWIPPVALLASLLVASVAGPVISNTRLAASDAGAAQSSAGRSQFLSDGLDQFASSPLFGVGLASGSSVVVPVVLAASGGLVLVVAYAIFVAVPLRQMWASRNDSLIAACLISAIAFLAMGIFNNSFAERFDYWALLCGASLASATRLVKRPVPKRSIS